MTLPAEEFKFESVQDCQSICSYLQALCEGFSKKHLELRSDRDAFAVTPAGMLKFTLKAKKKRDRVKLKIELSWKNGLEETGAVEDLVIGPDPAAE